MKILILTSVLFLFGCGTQKDISSSLNKDFSTKNDTIYYKSEPSGVVVHYGLVVDKHNNNNQLIIIKDINATEDVSMSMVNFVHNLHPNSTIELRFK